MKAQKNGFVRPQRQATTWGFSGPASYRVEVILTKAVQVQGMLLPWGQPAFHAEVDNFSRPDSLVLERQLAF
ncbi:hypothetical protein [Deinococcus misasensis]|uniref:hypothetical protein n=1 Tax=Deinococcus misasensis TaxID=392413 RepID=UPI0005585B92|nr:hypothetical protein [Deinococcus misasensis]